MKYINSKLAPITCLCFIVMAACGAPTTVTTVDSTPELPDQASECIPPIHPFSYPSGASNTKEPVPGRDFVVLPPAPWQAEASLPDLTKMNSSGHYDRSGVSIIGTRQIKDAAEVWINIALFDKELRGTYYLAAYRTDTKIWKTIPAQVDTLFIDSGGTIWGSNSSWSVIPKNAAQWVLSSYDERRNIFYPEQTLQNIPSGATNPDTEVFYYSKVFLDEDGTFWILVPNDAIYSYKPTSSRATRRMDISFIPEHAKMAPDGSIYIFAVRPWDHQFYQTNTIYRYFPKSNNMVSFAVDLELFPYFNNIFVDHLGRLWLDSIGYRDEHGIWYQTQRSPLFVSYSRESEYDYKYKSARIVTETSDGRLWFLHQENGMIYLDPQKGEWCWFTTYQSNIVEDSDHNLWMIADGKLYKYALGK